MTIPARKRLRRSLEQRDLDRIAEGAKWELVECFPAPKTGLDKFRAATFSRAAVRQLNRIARRCRKPARLV